MALTIETYPQLINNVPEIKVLYVYDADFSWKTYLIHRIGKQLTNRVTRFVDFVLRSLPCRPSP
jgi:hypothetical protein